MTSVKFLVCYFIVLLFSSSLIHARESKFFSKFTHFSTIKNAKETQLSPFEAPASAPVLSPAPAPTETTSTTTTTYGDDETELFDEEFEGGETYQKGSSNYNYNHNGYTNNNGYELVSTSSSHEDVYQNNNYNTNGYRGNYNNNGHEPVSTSSSHETYTSNGYKGNLNNNGYEPVSTSSGQETYTSNGYNGNLNDNGYKLVSTSSRYNSNNNNGYETNQRQGMSDTRFMEGGKYYYDVKNENYYYPSNGYQNQVKYENSVNENEFNTMDFENQEVYEDSQEESQP